MDISGEIHSLQLINAKGEKWFLSGGAKKGYFYLIGEVSNTIYIAEGYASAATICDATKECSVVAFDVGNLLPVALTIREKYPHVTIVLVADNDQWKDGGNIGVDKATHAAKAVGATIVIPNFKDISAKPTDINDLMMVEGMDEAKRQLQGEQWKENLIYKKDREGNFTETLRNHHANVVAILEGDRRWKGVIKYDEFSGSVMAVRKLPGDSASYPKYPRRWRDEDDTWISEWLLREYGLSIAPTRSACAIPRMARQNLFHPVKNYLSSLNWDGTERLNNWLIDFMGAQFDEQNKSYICAISANWMISAVARIFQPGCKVDAMMVLEGKQGLGKSRALNVLACDQWFTDEISAIGSKDAAQQLRGTWVVEFAELASLSKIEIEQTKAFVSRRIDRYRDTYARYVNDFPRQCVLAGSTNDAEYLKDTTGGRRFWPVKCTKINFEGLVVARDQLWAEAVVRYRRGESWWLSEEIEPVARVEQKRRRQPDPWEDRIAEYCKGRSFVTVLEVMEHVLFLSGDKINQQNQNRVAKILVSFKRERNRRTIGGCRKWGYS